MKKLIPLFLLTTLALTGCEKNDCTPEKISGSFAEGKTILVHYNEYSQSNHYSVRDGEHLVFRYEHRFPDCNLDDAKWGEVLNFEVDKDATQFRFAGNELSAAKGYFWVHNGIGSGHDYELSSGVIEGSKISNQRWLVKVDVTTTPRHPNEQPRKISFNREFMLSE